MELYDFENRKNRDLRFSTVSKEYIDYIKGLAKSDPFYPKFHVAPKHGLLNDPNGLVYVNGEYHIFYQWFPFGPVHGLKHWYHVATKDFIHYRDFGVANFPDSKFDLEGAYTGMMIENAIYYTGVVGNDKIPSTIKADFRENSFINKRQILKWDEQLTTLNFRDPFVWKLKDSYMMLTGAQNLQNKGQLTLHRSLDGENFESLGYLLLATAPEADMYECPNYIESDGKGLLIFSPQGMTEKTRYDYRNVFSVIYTIGNPIESDERRFDNKSYHELDKGFDFYAPQVFNDGKRDILIGWLGNSKCTYPSDKNQWSHMLTIPREISIRNDILIQKPIEELTLLRQQSYQVNDSEQLKAKLFELVIENTANFSIVLENEMGHYLSFSGQNGEYILNREHTTYPFNEVYGHQRYALKKMAMGHIRLFVDTSAIEIFCDDGETVFTSRFYIEDLNRLSLSGTTGKIYYLKNIEYS